MTPPVTNQSQPPVPITQLAWLLRGILSQDPDGNNFILHSLNKAPPVSSESAPLSSDSLSHEGLAFLSDHLAILASMLWLNEVTRCYVF